ncbi:MAG: PspA/IM30 family protein [Chloroflexi bacterium]|nr:PspA/IM30 family protein [Chloroflexota bacterium]
MPSILQKVRTLFSANLHGMIDRALETNSLKVMDEYIRQVERNLDALEDSAATVGGSVRTLKRKYEEFSNQTDKLDRDIDTLLLRGKNDLAAAAQAEMNTKQELAQEYYEQWQSQQEQYQGMLNMRMKLEGRLNTIKQEREKMRSLLELAETKKVMTKTLRSMDKLDTSGDQEIDSLLDSIYAQIDQEDARADMASRKLSDQIEDTVGIGQVELQLEERRQRLLGAE